MEFTKHINAQITKHSYVPVIKTNNLKKDRLVKLAKQNPGPLAIYKHGKGYYLVGSKLCKKEQIQKFLNAMKSPNSRSFRKNGELWLPTSDTINEKGKIIATKPELLLGLNVKPDGVHHHWFYVEHTQRYSEGVPKLKMFNIHIKIEVKK